MNRFDDMAGTEKLHALIDGDLPEAERQALLDRMSGDEELRRAYHELVELRSVIKADAAALVLPPEATTAVFSALGYGLGATADAVASAASGSSSGGASSPSLRRWLPLSLLAVSLAAVVLYFQLRVSPDNTIPSPVPQSSGEAATAHVAGNTAAAESATAATVAHPSPAPMQNIGARSNRVRANNTRVTGTIRPGRSTIQERRTVGANQNTATEPGAPAIRQETPERKADIPAEETPEKSTVRSPETKAGTELSGDQSNTVSPAPPAESIGERFAKPEPMPALGLRLTVRGIAAASFPKAATGSQSNSALRNIAVRLDYAIAERQSLGLEGGFEAFSQQFGRVEQGVYATYAQNPLEAWLAAEYERTLAALLPGALFLTARVDGGAVFNIGPMARISAGVRAHFSSRVGAELAAEGTLVAYRNEGLWLTTKKLGATAGLFISF